MAGPVAKEQPAPPGLIIIARRLLISSALLGLVRLLLELLDREMLVAEVRRRNPAMSQDQIDTSLNGGILISLLVAVVVVLAYTRLANVMARGRNWARIVLTVLAAGSVLFGLLRLLAWVSGIAAAVGVAVRPADMAITVVMIGLDIAAIVLMWRASAHFRRRVTVDTDFLRP